jgi:hypothetical protein
MHVVRWFLPSLSGPTFVEFPIGDDVTLERRRRLPASSGLQPPQLPHLQQNEHALYDVANPFTHSCPCLHADLTIAVDSALALSTQFALADDRSDTHDELITLAILP